MISWWKRSKKILLGKIGFTFLTKNTNALFLVYVGEGVCRVM